MLYFNYKIAVKVKINMDSQIQTNIQTDNQPRVNPIPSPITEVPKKEKKLLFLIFSLILFSLVAIFSGVYFFGIKKITNNNRNISVENNQPSPIDNSIVTQPTETLNVNSKIILKSDSRNKFSEMLFSDNLEAYLVLFTEDKKTCKLISPSLTKEYPCSEIGLQHKEIGNNGSSAYILPANKFLDKTLVFDGRELGTYRNIQKMSFSTDGKDFAYSAFVVPGEKNVMYLNGSEVKIDNCAGLVNFFFKPRSTKMDYLCADGDTKYVIFNGNKQNLSTQKNINIPDSIYISPDGSRYAFEKMYYDQTQSDPSVPIIPDIYGTDHTLTLDGKESKKYKIIHDVVFSSDGSRLAYIGVYRDNSRNMFSELVVDGKIIKTVPNSSSIELNRDISNVVFSPDNKTLAYTVVSDDGQDELFINETPQGKYSFVSNFTYSPNGKHFAFTAKKTDSTENNIFPGLESAMESEKNPYPDKLIIIDGKIFKTLGVVSSIKFTQDSGNILYYGFQGTDLWFNADKLN